MILEEIRQYLISEGVSAGEIFINILPPELQNCSTLAYSSGSMNGVYSSLFEFRIITRATSFAKAEEVTQNFVKLLHQKNRTDLNLPTVKATNCVCTALPLFIGNDDNNSILYSTNFRITIKI